MWLLLSLTNLLAQALTLAIDTSSVLVNVACKSFSVVLHHMYKESLCLDCNIIASND